MPSDQPSRPLPTRRSPSTRPGSRSRSPIGSSTAIGARPTDEKAGGEDAVYRAISRALLEGKLRPGTPLRERSLAEMFGVTRGAVRKVLLRLGNEGKLQLLANRGAYVPEPSRDDVRHIYDARKAVESGLVAVLATRIGDEQLAHLRAHVRDERRAERLHRRDESVKLAGEFHVQLVQVTDNAELTPIVQRLVARTQMFVALYEPARYSGCAPDEHNAVVDALAARDPARAAVAMLEHLQQVEERVIDHLDGRTPPDLESVLRSILEQDSGPA